MLYLYIFISICLCLCVLIISIKLRETNIRKALNLPRYTVPTDDSFTQAKEIGNFLHQRAEVCGIYFHKTPDTCGIERKDYYRISSGEAHTVAQLIRLCHAVGCEIIIRQTGTDDLEDSSNTPDVFAEKVIKMQQQRSM